MSDPATQNIKQIWESALNEIELHVSRANFTTWFKNTELVKEAGGIVYLGVPNSFVKEWLHSKYNKFILKSISVISASFSSGIVIILPPRIL